MRYFGHKCESLGTNAKVGAQMRMTRALTLTLALAVSSERKETNCPSETKNDRGGEKSRGLTTIFNIFPKTTRMSSRTRPFPAQSVPACPGHVLALDPSTDSTPDQLQRNRLQNLKHGRKVGGPKSVDRASISTR